MRRLPRTQFGNPILRRKTKNVLLSAIKKPAFRSLVRQMFYTIKNIGVGLAAPQIGKSIRLAVIRIKRSKIHPHVVSLPRTTIINPHIVSKSKKEASDWEGCLSFPRVRGLVPRRQNINVEYIDEYGKKQKKQLSGFQARVFQHEVDHLNGILYIDRMRDMKTLITHDEFRKRVLKRGLRSK